MAKFWVKQAGGNLTLTTLRWCMNIFYWYQCQQTKILCVCVCERDRQRQREMLNTKIPLKKVAGARGCPRLPREDRQQGTVLPLSSHLGYNPMCQPHKLRAQAPPHAAPTDTPLDQQTPFTNGERLVHFIQAHLTNNRTGDTYGFQTKLCLRAGIPNLRDLTPDALR